VPNSDLLIGLGCEADDNSWVLHDPAGGTTVAGVWVAGNVADPRAQVITAAGQGSAAAIALNADLVNEDVTRAMAGPTHQPASTRRFPLRLAEEHAHQRTVKPSRF
jgi:hypothetical protein